MYQRFQQLTKRQKISMGTMMTWAIVLQNLVTKSISQTKQWEKERCLPWETGSSKYSDSWEWLVTENPAVTEWRDSRKILLGRQGFFSFPPPFHFSFFLCLSLSIFLSSYPFVFSFFGHIVLLAGNAEMAVSGEKNFLSVNKLKRGGLPQTCFTKNLKLKNLSVLSMVLLCILQDFLL